MYQTNEMNGLILPEGITPTKEFYRVMGINSREIYCVYEIDPDCTCHPAGTPWDVNWVHKGLPFMKWAGVNGLTITWEERAKKELEDTAPIRKETKAKKREEVQAEAKERKEFETMPESAKVKTVDMKTKKVK